MAKEQSKVHASDAPIVFFLRQTYRRLRVPQLMLSQARVALLDAGAPGFQTFLGRPRTDMLSHVPLVESEVSLSGTAGNRNCYGPRFLPGHSESLHNRARHNTSHEKDSLALITLRAPGSETAGARAEHRRGRVAPGRGGGNIRAVLAVGSEMIRVLILCILPSTANISLPTAALADGPTSESEGEDVESWVDPASWFRRHRLRRQTDWAQAALDVDEGLNWGERRRAVAAAGPRISAQEIRARLVALAPAPGRRYLRLSLVVKRGRQLLASEIDYCSGMDGTPWQSNCEIGFPELAHDDSTFAFCFDTRTRAISSASDLRGEGDRVRAIRIRERQCVRAQDENLALFTFRTHEQRHRLGSPHSATATVA